MTDYKQLCAELVRISDALNSRTPLTSNQGQALDGYSALAAFRDVANRARAALAETEPEGPTDEELEEEFGRALLKLPGDSMNATAVAFARAVLARWGNHPESPDSSTQPQ